MLPSGWCSNPGLGNGEELATSFPSCCYLWAGKQSCSFSLCRHSDAKEGRRRRSAMLAWAALLRVPGSRQPQTCSMLLSSPTTGAGRTAAPGASSSCLSPPARRGWPGESGSSSDPVHNPGRRRVNASTGILQRCTLVLLLPVPLSSLAGNAPAFPLRSALLRLCSLRQLAPAEGSALFYRAFPRGVPCECPPLGCRNTVWR